MRKVGPTDLWQPWSDWTVSDWLRHTSALSTFWQAVKLKSHSPRRRASWKPPESQSQISEVWAANEWKQTDTNNTYLQKVMLILAYSNISIRSRPKRSWYFSIRSLPLQISLTRRRRSSNRSSISHSGVVHFGAVNGRVICTAVKLKNRENWSIGGAICHGSAIKCDEISSKNRQIKQTRPALLYCISMQWLHAAAEKQLFTSYT